MKNQLGRQVETNFSVKLACQSANWGKLMLFGELRGTKMELRGTLEAPKEAPREPKWGPRRLAREQRSEPGPRGGVGEG